MHRQSSTTKPKSRRNKTTRIADITNKINITITATTTRRHSRTLMPNTSQEIQNTQSPNSSHYNNTRTNSHTITLPRMQKSSDQHNTRTPNTINLGAQGPFVSDREWTKQRIRKHTHNTPESGRSHYDEENASAQSIAQTQAHVQKGIHPENRASEE